MTKEKGVAIAADRVPVDGDVIRLVENAFAYCLKEAQLSTTGISDTVHNKYVGQVSIIKRSLTSKDGDLLSQYDNNDESQAQVQNTSLNLLFLLIIMMLL